MVFFTLYLQLLGMSDFAASLLMAVFLGGTAIGMITQSCTYSALQSSAEHGPTLTRWAPLDNNPTALPA